MPAELAFYVPGSVKSFRFGQWAMTSHYPELERQAEGELPEQRPSHRHRPNSSPRSREIVRATVIAMRTGLSALGLSTKLSPSRPSQE